MPIRFQVDGDFYDHPKTTGMSDAAFALWVRAGSFSAAKATDGLVSDDVLAHTLRYDTAVADELVRRRLWRRVKGGYRFHEWDHRNLTKARIEDDRKADRQRKAVARRRGTQIPNAEVEAQSVRPESERNPNGIQPESAGIPDASVSVSVSVSESVSGSGRGSPPPAGAGPEPPPRCPQHLHDRNPPPCGACADARRAADQSRADRDARHRAAPRCRIHPGEAADACRGCRADAIAAPTGSFPVIVPTSRRTS